MLLIVRNRRQDDFVSSTCMPSGLSYDKAPLHRRNPPPTPWCGQSMRWPSPVSRQDNPTVISHTKHSCGLSVCAFVPIAAPALPHSHVHSISTASEPCKAVKMALIIPVGLLSDAVHIYAHLHAQRSSGVSPSASGRYKMSKKSLPLFGKNLFLMGWTFICTGIACNEWVLTKILSPDGMVEIQNRAAIRFFNIIFISLGLFFVQLGKFGPPRDGLRRLSQSYPRIFACSIGLSLTILLVVCAEGIFYGLNHYQKENAVEEVSWIRMPLPGEEGGPSEPPPRRVQG